MNRVTYAGLAATLWFFANFVSWLLGGMFGIGLVGVVIGLLFEIQSYLYEQLIVFDKRREVAPGVGVFVPSDGLFFFVMAQSFLIFLAGCFLLPVGNRAKSGERRQ